jgi:hypothetical protein
MKQLWLDLLSDQTDMRSYRFVDKIAQLFD